MNKQKLIKFLDFLKESNYKIFAPQKKDEDLKIFELENSKDFEIINELPLWGWKQFVYPPKQNLFKYKKDELTEIEPEVINQVLMGMSIIDLRALTYLNFIFENDAYYQEIKKRTLVVGHSLAPSPGYEKFFGTFKENQLEHLQFDIFLAVLKDNFKVYTGSEEGQRILDEFGYKDYQNIQYVGYIKEEGVDPQVLNLHDKLLNNHKPKVWQDLDKRCIECGKCSIVCPLCYCFMIDDYPKLNPGEGERKRTWDTCFYSEFSQVAGPAPEAEKHKFINKTGSKIHYWYSHKFIRWVEQYSVWGCVMCGRCSKACPAGIKLPEVIQDVLGDKSDRRS